MNRERRDGNNMYVNLAINVREARLFFNMTQKQLAKFLNVSSDSVRKTEHNMAGGFQYNAIVLLTLSRGLGCSFEELFCSDFQETVLQKKVPPSIESVAVNLRTIRHRAGLSQEDFGSMLGGYSRRQISDAERCQGGKLIKDPVFLFAVADFAKCSVDDLFSSYKS